MVPTKLEIQLKNDNAEKKMTTIIFVKPVAKAPKESAEEPRINFTLNILLPQKNMLVHE